MTILTKETLKMKPRKRVFFVLVVAIMLLTGMGPDAVGRRAMAAEGDIVVFAAASTTNAISEIGDLYSAKHPGHVQPSFASSSTLAKQIASGAPADVYLSANKKWMDFLEEKNAIDKHTRFDLLGNRIVLIVPTRSALTTIDVKPGMALAQSLGSDGRLAMGDPAHVPAGIYGKQALEKLGLWDQVKDHLAPMKDVRAALAMAERAETPLGLVYATDAAITKKVRVVGTFPADSHPPIVYPVAAVAGGKAEAAARFLDFLKSPQARAVFEKYGFSVR
jgi:molybdate transport system substrate-binding protein